MRHEPVLLRVVLLACCVAPLAHAQTPQPAQREPANARLCERLAGAARAQCERDEASRSELQARRELGGSCDALIGPEKERCLHEGGTVEASGRALRERRSQDAR